MSKVETVKIQKSVFEGQVKEGKSLEFLMEFYGLKESQIRKAVKDAGLKLKRQIAPAFVFVDETSTATETAEASAKEEAKKDESIF